MAKLTRTRNIGTLTATKILAEDSRVIAFTEGWDSEGDVDLEFFGHVAVIDDGEDTTYNIKMTERETIAIIGILERGLRALYNKRNTMAEKSGLL